MRPFAYVYFTLASLELSIAQFRLICYLSDGDLSAISGAGGARATPAAGAGAGARVCGGGLRGGGPGAGAGGAAEGEGGLEIRDTADGETCAGAPAAG